MPSSAHRFDVVCRVIDNYGDAGVAWRLARQLAAEHAVEVTLWIDDLDSLAPIAPDLDPRAADQRGERVRVRKLSGESAPDPLPEVLIEAFGCGLPAAWLDAMSAAARPPVWINLEYLSAEAWVDGVHGLPSPHPQRPLTRWFFFPGFTAATGGLLRERQLLAQRDTFQRQPAAREAPWHSLGLAAPPPEAITVSLFCYPSEALPALLAAWRDGDTPVACLVPERTATAALDRFFGAAARRTGEAIRTGALTVASAPFVDQPAFDRRLWACDLNVVRGEDSFLRAQWAGRPFAWHIYPQAEQAHRVKLAAFLDRYCAGLDCAAAEALRGFSEAFNVGDGTATAAAWRPLCDALPALAGHARGWAAELAQRQDLAAQLVDFARRRL